MAEKSLDQSRVGAFVRQRIAGGVPEHVGMHLDVQLRGPARLADDVLQSVHRQRATTLGLEHIEAGDFPAELAQVAQLVAVQAMRAVDAALEPGDV